MSITDDVSIKGFQPLYCNSVWMYKDEESGEMFGKKDAVRLAFKRGDIGTRRVVELGDHFFGDDEFYYEVLTTASERIGKKLKNSDEDFADGIDFLTAINNSRYNIVPKEKTAEEEAMEFFDEIKKNTNPNEKGISF